MPTWLIILLVASVTCGFVYCLALWNANRDCRNCRIAFFIIGEVSGCWLLFNGWSENNNQHVVFGSIILVVVNLWFVVRYSSSSRGKNNAPQEEVKTEREKGSEGAGLAVAATAVAATAGIAAQSSDEEKTGPGQESTPETDGDVDADLDIGLDL